MEAKDFACNSTIDKIHSLQDDSLESYPQHSSSTWSESYPFISPRTPVSPEIVGMGFFSYGAVFNKLFNY